MLPRRSPGRRRAGSAYTKMFFGIMAQNHGMPLVGPIANRQANRTLRYIYAGSIYRLTNRLVLCPMLPL
jgi:hypothetical protein